MPREPREWRRPSSILFDIGYSEVAYLLTFSVHLQ
jgi:hypothetical protein